MLTTFNICELIKKVSQKPFLLSRSWLDLTTDLQRYLENGNLDFYKINGINPQIFDWPENSQQNINQLAILEQHPSTIFMVTLLKNNNYGPLYIRTYRNIQLDRVQQVWSVFKLVNTLQMDMNKVDEIVFEFGGGTGQMSDVLYDLNFKGKHVVYDLPLMTVLQKYFVSKQRIETKHILDDDATELINGTNYLPCNQNMSEKHIMGLPNINFLATYSLTETDEYTRNKFAEYMIHFSRIYIVYWPGKHEVGDYVDNDDYIQKIKKKIENTHFFYDDDNFGNGKMFIAIKRELVQINPFI